MKALELGQKIFDADYLEHGIIIARNTPTGIQVLDGHEDHPMMQDMLKYVFSTNFLDRLYLAESGEIHYTWTNDPAVTEVK